MYRVKEIFRTLQGEGGQSGTPMVFVRFSGCNLWSGHEADRARDAARHAAECPRWCDTDFVAGDKLGVDELADRVQALAGPRWICFTGGEPTLQLDRALLDATRAAGYRAAVETNGSVDLAPIRDLLDWVCVSPKQSELIVRAGDELKVIYTGQPDEEVRRLEALDFRHRFLQPAWGPEYQRNLDGAVRFLESQPLWRLSLQTHKLIGLR